MAIGWRSCTLSAAGDRADENQARWVFVRANQEGRAAAELDERWVNARPLVDRGTNAK